MKSQISPLLEGSPRTQIVCGCSEAGSWEMATRPPHPQLSGFVLGYVGLKSRITLARERHLPSGEVELLINLAHPYRVLHPAVGADWTKHRDAVLIGVHDSYVFSEETGEQHVVVVRLQPAGAHVLFDVPMRDLANRFVELDQLSPEIARSLPARLYEAHWETRFSIIDSVIARRPDRVRTQALRAAWAWNKLRNAEGLLSISRLADMAGCSQKHLIDLFADYVGLSPKAVARVIRFNRAVKSIATPVDLPQVALDCGYYDQAHFSRDFKAFAGCSPTELVRSAAGPVFRAEDTSGR